MTQTAVVKKNRVKMGEPHSIGVGPSASGGAGAGAAVQPAVRIAEQHADRAILAVQCACGQITYVECRWKDPAPENETAAGRPGVQDPSPENDKEDK